jgi:hypothetical protein
MAFNSTTLPTNARNRVRLLVGDVADIPWLDDGVYNYTLDKNEGDELKAAYEVLSYVESRITLEPVSSSNGFVDEERPLLDWIAIRKKELLDEIAKRDGKYAPPVVVRSDRKNWNDIDSIFNGIINRG